VLRHDLAFVKTRAVVPKLYTQGNQAGHAVWSLPDFRLVECNQGFLDMFGWKVIPYQPFYLNSLLKMDVNKMVGNCVVLQQFLAEMSIRGDANSLHEARNITKRFKRTTGESFTCTVVLSLILEKNVFVTMLYEV